MNRRSLVHLLLPLVALAGCSKPRRRRAGLSGLPSGPATRLKGPQGFGGMMAKEWAKDLGDASAEKRVRAAQELANMGPAAKSALPALEKAARDKNGEVSAAAKRAIAAIRK